MTTVHTLVSAFERGGLSRRELVLGLTALIAAAGESTADAQSAPAIPAVSLNHVSLAVADPEASKQFFQRTFGMPITSKIFAFAYWYAVMPVAVCSTPDSSEGSAVE